MVKLFCYRHYELFYDPGNKTVVSKRMFATLEQAEEFIKNSVLPCVQDGIDDPEDLDLHEKLKNPLVDMDTLANALCERYPDLAVNDGETSTISFTIEKLSLTSNVEGVKLLQKGSELKRKNLFLRTQSAVFDHKKIFTRGVCLR